MSIEPHSFLFGGGLDLASASLAVPAGRIIAGLNYEPLAEGYGRVDGYERYDGKAAPSSVQFWRLSFKTGTVAIVAGATIIGATSGATAYVLLDPQDFFGTWGAGDARGNLILGQLTGSFTPGETIKVGITNVAVANGVEVANGSPDEATRKDYVAAAQDKQRSLITPPPGIGPVRGVHVFNGTLYAWRDSSGGPEAKMFRATTSGWQQVDLGKTLPFTLGLVEVIEGSTITGASSGATAVAQRVIKRAGSWGSNASGFIALTGIVGTFSAGETIKVGATNVATGGLVATISLPPGGRYMAINHNFYGSKNRLSAYVVNGVGPAFEFDGTTVVPILSGMTVDTPVRVFEIANHLGLCFAGGSVQISSLGEPAIFNAITGALEIGLGTEITDVIQSSETAVVLFGAQKIGILTGRDAASFQLDELTEEAGAEPWTAQRIGKTVYLDARGLRDLTATQSYGNFKAGLLSEIIEPYFRAKRMAGVRPVMSWVSRTKSQYRLLWDDGSGLCVYMGRKVPEAIPFDTGDTSFTCVATGEMSDGEGIFAGAEDGYVYRLDSGPSFDGTGVRAFVMTPFNHLGSVMMEKNLRKTTIDLKAEPLTRIGVTVIFDSADGEQPRSGLQEFDVRGAGGFWNVMVWNSFFWSSAYMGKVEAYTEGQGANMAAVIICESHPAESSNTLQSYTMHILKRKTKR